MRTTTFDHEFLEFIPAGLEPDRIYISVEYATASHLCACGCGQRVVTPLTPADWKLTYDGETITLWPSIGNWSFDCQSHYFIRRGQVAWAQRWSRVRIDHGRATDRALKGDPDSAPLGCEGPERLAGNFVARLGQRANSFWRRLLNRVRRDDSRR